MESTDLQHKLKEEKEFLNKVYTKYTLHDDPQTRAMREFACRIIRPYLNKEGHGLELGCSDGYFSEMLASELKALDIVDGSLGFIEEAKKRNIKGARYFHSLFEEFTPDTDRNCAVMSGT